MKHRHAAIAAALLTGACALGAGKPKLEIKHIWFYCHPNLNSDQSLADTVALMKRAAKAGYTGIVLVENRMQRWTQVTPQYLENMAKFRQACRDNRLDCVAAVTPLGYANDLLSNDPDLAEGMPVVDAPFVARDGRLVPNDPTSLVNGAFEQVRNGKPVGWDMDMPGQISFVDTEVTHEGRPSLRFEDPGTHDPQYAHCRAWQSVSVQPFRYYHLSCWVKTEDFQPAGDTRLMALGSKGPHEGLMLNVPELAGIRATQDWTLYHKTFNAQDFTEVVIYIGSWSARRGKAWFADVRLEPGGLVNLLRRGGAPFKAASPDGSIVYEEGKDLPEMRDPLLGNSPYRGGFRWHEQPVIAIPPGSRLHDGDQVLLSYYHTAIMCYDDQVPICMSEPKTYDLIRWHIAGVHTNLAPDYYFMEHDEIRMQGWDASCQATGKTCGGILADNIRKCTGIIKAEDPGKGIFVWSDMFDPHHNAQKTGYYYLCRGEGPWHGSWEGLSKDVGLINWNAGNTESVEFFVSRGHPQILSHADPDLVVEWLRKCAGGSPGIVGVIYVTWSNDFSKLESYAQAVRAFEKEYNSAEGAQLIRVSRRADPPGPDHR